MNDLRKRFLHKVVIIRDGSTSDGLHGLVTQIIEESATPLTVLLWAMEGFSHTNYYSPSDVELTDEQWTNSLVRDTQLRAVYDKTYTHLWYICGPGGRDINGYGTEGIAWSHWFQEHDEATAALHTLIEEVHIGTSVERLENEGARDTDGGRAGHARVAGKLEDVGGGRRTARS
jgi:hypothetical protein